MSARSVTSPPRKLTLRLRPMIGLLAILIVAMLLDGPVYHLTNGLDVEHEDWYQALRQVGYFPTWLTISIAVWLLDRRTSIESRHSRPGHHRAGLIALSSGLSGLLAETLKPFSRRMRPEFGDGSYVFRPIWDEPLSGSGIGFPSGHTATAFGGAVMLAFLFPALRWPALIIAAGCGISRILAGAHYLSDTVAGAALATAIALALYRAGEGPRTSIGGGLRIQT